MRLCVFSDGLKLRKLLLLVVLGTLASLSAMAYAEPPDQSWRGGFFDDDDDDDVILLITSGSAAVDPFLLAAVLPIPPLIGSVLPMEDAPVLTRIVLSGDPRAPPLA
jgi:hypothetical protein